MAIYKMVGDKERLEPILETSFSQESVQEVQDLQRILLAQPEILEPGLFIIRAEFSEWRDSKRRIDLLALDKEGRLVVVELKRGETGDHSELQAIRYAAMVANLTLDKVVDTYQAYFGVDQDEARSRIHEHLGVPEEDDAVIYTENPRIILACEDFNKELTTSVLWLNACELDIKCIRLKPYRIGEEILVESSQIIPIPEAADFTEQFRERERENRDQRSSQTRRVPGGDAFKQSIGSAREQFQPELKRFYDWAVALEQEELVELSTYEGTEGGKEVIRLALKVPKKSTLVQFFSSGNIRFWPVNFNRLAPGTMRRLDSSFGLNLEDGKTHYRSLSTIGDVEAFLNSLTDAYREANGRLTDD